jgi:hypothetical protein
MGRLAAAFLIGAMISGPQVTGATAKGVAAPRVLSFPKETDVQTLCEGIETALIGQRFALLDATELAMRDPDVRLVGGNSQLYHYYGALGDYSDSPLFLCRSRLTFDQKRQLLEQWVTAAPRSTAPHIALAQLWSNAGWTARGDEYSDKVSEKQWKTLAFDLANAQSALSGLNGRDDPHFYYLMIAIARGSSNPRPVLDRLYRSAINAYPGYFHYYSQRADLLQERWYGQSGEMRDYAASVLQSPGGDAGLVAYSYVTFSLMQFYERSTLLQVTGLSWPTIQTAYAKRGELYGLRNRDWNVLFNLALAAIDRDAAKTALEQVQNNWDPAVWKERRYFDYAVSWTMTSQKQ